jgi:small-conductance mechanosensitive channel
VLALTQTGRLVATAAIVGAAALVALVGGAVAGRRSDDRSSEYHLRRVIRYAVVLVAALALLSLWRVFHGRTTLVLGLALAGLTFALQEVVGAIAGWFNILSGRIYRVGDRVEIAGVHGDVIDVTLMRTKLLEFGSEVQPGDEPSSWVHGRQYTGRIVTLSNKTSFTEAVFNYSAALGFVWEEVAVPIPYSGDWKLAERILQEEADRISSADEAEPAIRALEQRYPVPATEIEPRVFVQMTDNWMQLAARFVVPVRQARTLKSELARRVRERFDEAGIQIASSTMDVTVYQREPRPRREV